MKPEVAKNKVIIEYDKGDFYILYPNGDIEVACSRADALKYVKSRMAKLGKKLKAMVVTKVEWRNIPDSIKHEFDQ